MNGCQYENHKFSVGGFDNKNFDDNYDDTFGVREDPKACTICKGRGRDAGGVECEACAGTGLRAWQTKGL